MQIILNQNSKSEIRISIYYTKGNKEEEDQLEILSFNKNLSLSI